MLRSSILCLAFLLFAKEENWKQLQHLWVEEKLNKVVSGVQGRLHFHQLEGMGRNEKKTSKIYQVRRAGTGYVRLGSSYVWALSTVAPLMYGPWAQLRRERGKCLSHTLGGEEPDTWERAGWWQGGAGFNLAYFVLFASFYNEHGFLL